MGVQKKAYSFRFEEDMVSELLKVAENENRTLSNLVETILKDYLKERKKAEQE